MSGGLSVRQTEALVKRLSAEKPEKKAPPAGVDYVAEAQRDLSARLGRGVKIVTGRKKGRIELEYYGLDDLNDLLRPWPCCGPRAADPLSERKRRSVMKFEKRSGGGEEAPVSPQEEKPTGKKPVVIYIMVLFIVAFLLMALSFVMHQRATARCWESSRTPSAPCRRSRPPRTRCWTSRDQLDDAEETVEALESAGEETQAALEGGGTGKPGSAGPVPAPAALRRRRPGRLPETHRRHRGGGPDISPAGEGRRGRHDPRGPLSAAEGRRGGTDRRGQRRLRDVSREHRRSGPRLTAPAAGPIPNNQHQL